jgi:hypothetical protein
MKKPKKTESDKTVEKERLKCSNPGCNGTYRAEPNLSIQRRKSSWERVNCSACDQCGLLHYRGHRIVAYYGENGRRYYGFQNKNGTISQGSIDD